METATPPSLRGRFVEDRYSLDVSYRPPMSFHVVRDGGDVTEITDGTTTVLVKDGRATAHDTERLVVHNGMRSFVMPWKFTSAGYIQQSRQLSDITGELILNRHAWAVRVSGQDGKPDVDVCIDAETGMVLTMRAPGRFAGFESLDVGVDLPDELFIWNGAIDDDRRS
jgi:hypothetical protein